VDPIYKKPLYHFLPGSLAFSIATIGCNFHCGFCQNWQISQVSKKEGDIVPRYKLLPSQVVEQALKSDCRSISYTYTEPTIFFEYAYDTARLAKEKGLLNNFVTNGYMTPDSLDTIQPFLDAANVDLKSFRENFYKKNCKARLQPVLDSIEYMKKLGIWIEVTTLIIPGENDSPEELNDIAQFIASVGREIPWHISRFHPDHHFTDHAATSVDLLKRARDVGRTAGLRYVYLGNVYEGHSTYCYQCDALLVDRNAFSPREIRISEKQCPSCGAEIDGIWISE
jgi:pyruvate formate lyase activating enzyme